MDEAFLALFFGGLVLLLFLGSLFGLIAFLQLRGIKRRLKDLESPRAPAPVAPVAPRVAPAPVAPAPPPPPPRETKDWSSAAPTRAEPPPIVPQPAVAAAAPAPPPKPRINLERWLGIRGAAVLGGVFLAIAGLLFFQYAVQHDWITKELRVAIGVGVGIACVLGGQWRRRRYGLTGDALTAGGVVVLYAASWAAHKHYGIVPFGVSFAAMVLVTAACCWLSWRNASQLISVLGLLGGF